MCRLIATYPTAKTAKSSPASTKVAGVAAPCTANTTGEAAATAEITIAAIATTPSRLRCSPRPATAEGCDSPVDGSGLGPSTGDGGACSADGIVAPRMGWSPGGRRPGWGLPATQI